MNLKELLSLTIQHEASDLHLCIGLPPVMRINNKLERIGDTALTADDILEKITRVVSDKEIDIHSLNDMDLSLEIEGLARFRVNIYREIKGLCLAFRYIPNRIKSLTELGLPESAERACHLHRGMVIVTGVTGSGKSTTLAAIINKINTERSAHIITIEDPIEFIYEHKKSIVNQREIGTHTPSFLEALRAALREDPNIILVGELRDLDTISMAITAAETGHLVLTTLHTRGAAQTVDRLIDVFPPHQQEQVRCQLSDVLEMVMSQLLVTSKDGKIRHLATEIMNVTPAIRHLIRDKKSFQLRNEIEVGRQDGMHTLDKSLQKLINEGKISIETALPWINDRKSFEAYSADQHI